MSIVQRIVPIICWKGNTRAQGAKIEPIWEIYPHLDIFPKRVLNNLPPPHNLLYAASPLKPSILDTCVESRKLGLKFYEKIILRPGSTVSYAWINYDVDILSIEQEERYESFKNCGKKVKRLKFTADIGLEKQYWTLSCGLWVFPTLVECFVVAMGIKIDNQALAYNQYGFKYREDNLYIIDTKTGFSMPYRSVQKIEKERIQKIEKKEKEEEEEEGGDNNNT